MAHLLSARRPGEAKLPLVAGCKVHFDLYGHFALRGANLYALMYPSHLATTALFWPSRQVGAPTSGPFCHPSWQLQALTSETFSRRLRQAGWRR